MSRASAQRVSTSPESRSDDPSSPTPRLPPLGRLRAAVLLAWGDTIAVAGAIAALLPLLARPPAARAPAVVAVRPPEPADDAETLGAEEGDACASES